MCGTGTPGRHTDVLVPLKGSLLFVAQWFKKKWDKDTSWKKFHPKYFIAIWGWIFRKYLWNITPILRATLLSSRTSNIPEVHIEYILLKSLINKLVLRVYYFL